MRMWLGIQQSGLMHLHLVPDLTSYDPAQGVPLAEPRVSASSADSVVQTLNFRGYSVPATIELLPISILPIGSLSTAYPLACYPVPSSGQPPSSLIA